MTDQRIHFAQTPWEMAQRSARVARARDLVLNGILLIDDEHLRANVCAMLLAVGCHDARIEANVQDELAPCHLLLLSDPVASVPHAPGQETALTKLAASLPYDPVWAAPGANLSSHHCYPGGWVLHTALDLQALLHLTEQAEHIKGVACDKDALIAAIILHDWAKLKLMTWSAEHDLDADQGVGHHEVALAECMLRNLPPQMIRLLAGVHSGWWARPDGVRRSIERAAQWVSIDPMARGYLDPQRDELSVDTWVVNQAEACWGLAKPVIQALEGLLTQWYAQAGFPYDYKRVRHALYASLDELQLIQELARGDVAQLEFCLQEWISGVTEGV